MHIGDARSGLATDYSIHDDKSKEKACRIRGAGETGSVDLGGEALMQTSAVKGVSPNSGCH